jgi:Cytochrome c554 and c-prime
MPATTGPAENVINIPFPGISRGVKMNIKKLILLSASLLLLTLWGCSSTDSGGNSVVPDELQDQIFNAKYVGAALCVNCHQDPNVFDDPDFAARSQELTGEYLNGAHVIHSDQINAGSETACLTCHDPIGDGPLLEQFINQADIPAEGLAAVTCENCHGSGYGHWGIGPLPDSSPNYNVCGKCHNDALPDSLLPHPPEGDNILARYLGSQHFASGSINASVCARCHTDEGARIYRSVETRSDLLALVEPVDTNEPVQCRTCHNGHAPDTLLREEIETNGQVTGSAEYATCTNCHQGDNAAVTGPDTGLLDTLIFHEAQQAQVITDSHYDDPATPDMIEGYVVNRNSETACSDCHNPHDVLDMTLPASLTLNEQWAESSHGGHLREVKRETAAAYANMVPSMAGTAEQTKAMKEAAVTVIWSNYNWDDESAGDCQRCHTATGLKNFLTDPNGYALDGSNNDFSHLAGWQPAGGSGQNELLYCWGCHSDGVGNLRNRGNSLPLFDRNNQLFATMPDIGKSTVCLACHGGRGNTDTMINSPRTSLFQGHGPTRGALVFTDITRIGYEFAGLDYSNSRYLHNMIGRNNDTPESGTGPCVGCHMPDINHTFTAAEYDQNGILTTVTNPSLCNTCHVSIIGYLPFAKRAQNEGIGLLQDYVDNTITNYLNIDISANFETVPLDAYGAFQNWKYFSEGDPCGYVHNGIYTKRLLFDSIDWLDNGVLNGTITIPVSLGNLRIWLFADSNGIAVRP